MCGDQNWGEQRITGWEPFTTTPKLDRRTVTWNKLDSVLGIRQFLSSYLSIVPDASWNKVNYLLVNLLKFSTYWWTNLTNCIYYVHRLKQCTI